MTPVECVRLVKFVGARCPAMRMQEDTPEAWYLDLIGYDLTDALEAARRATLDKAFIGIGDLIRECQAIVDRRLGQQRRAQIEAKLHAENPPTTAVTDKPRPLAALMAGRPLKAIPRGGYDGPTRRHLDSQRMEQARAELDAVRATPSDATAGPEPQP